MRWVLQLLQTLLNLPFMSNPLFLKRRTRPSPNPHLLVAQQRTLGMTGLSAYKFSQTTVSPTNGNYSYSKIKDKKGEAFTSDNFKELSSNTSSKGTFSALFREHQPKITFQKPVQLNPWTGYFNQDKKIQSSENIKIGKDTGTNSRVEVRQAKLSQEGNITNKGNTTFGTGNTNTNNLTPIKKHQPYHEQSLPQPLTSIKQTALLTKTPPKQIQSASNKENTPTTPHKKVGTLPPSFRPNLVGLNNIGNTCYMNSILQCLLNLPNFSEKLLEIKASELTSKCRVAPSYLKFVEMMKNSSKSSENPAELKVAIGNKKPRFSGYSQQDAQEFLTSLLELLSSDLNRVKAPKYKELTADLTKQTLQQIVTMHLSESQEWWQYNKSRQDSIVSDFFTGQMLSRVVCSRCRNQSIAFDNTWDYALTFSSNEPTSLYKLFENFLKEETISKDYYCNKCKGKDEKYKGFEECTRKLDFYRLPKILVLQLKRFSFGKYSKHKINTKVIVQEQLNLSKFLSHSSHSNPSKDLYLTSTQYQLVGIVHHAGDIDFGHYTAECMNPYNQKWYNFNDAHVGEVSMQKFQSNTPYLLFYARKDSLT